MQVAPF
jgi:hypothetical protein